MNAAPRPSPIDDRPWPIANGPAAPRARRRRGYSLVELTVASAIASLLLLAVASAVVLASHALPARDGPAVRAADASRAYERLTSEIAYAVAVIEQDPQAVTLLLARRNGETDPRRVRWAWAGTGGDPLTRQVNDNDPLIVLEDVADFQLQYDHQLVTWTYEAAPQLGPEQVIAREIGVSEHDTWRIETDRWMGQYILPELDDDVLAWRPTEIAVVLRRSNLLGNASTLFQLRSATLHRRPTGAVLTQGVFPGALLDLLSSLSWRNIAFNDDAELLPGQAVVVTAVHPNNTSSHAATIQYNAPSSSSPIRGLVWTTDAGSSWGYSNNHELRHYLYGRPLLHGGTQTSSRQHLRRIAIRLAPGGTSLRALHGSAELPTRPPALDAFWELDFTRDPTTVDVNGDGQGDWVVHGGGSFASASLSNGVWHVGQRLDAQPTHRFNRLTQIHLRMRQQQDNPGRAPVMHLNADWTDGLCAPLTARLIRTGSRQRFILDNDGQRIMQVDQLPLGFRDIRLLIDPTHQTVRVIIDGQHRGTVGYQRVSTAGYSQGAYLTALEHHQHSHFSFVRIRVGGAP